MTHQVGGEAEVAESQTAISGHLECCGGVECCGRVECCGGEKRCYKR